MLDVVCGDVCFTHLLNSITAASSDPQPCREGGTSRACWLAVEMLQQQHQWESCEGQEGFFILGFFFFPQELSFQEACLGWVMEKSFLRIFLKALKELWVWVLLRAACSQGLLMGGWNEGSYSPWGCSKLLSSASATSWAALCGVLEIVSVKFAPPA